MRRLKNSETLPGNSRVGSSVLSLGTIYKRMSLSLQETYRPRMRQYSCWSGHKMKVADIDQAMTAFVCLLE
jgi:hypothetical protein